MYEKFRNKKYKQAVYRLLEKEILRIARVNNSSEEKLNKDEILDEMKYKIINGEMEEEIKKEMDLIDEEAKEQEK